MGFEPGCGKAMRQTDPTQTVMDSTTSSPASRAPTAALAATLSKDAEALAYLRGQACRRHPARAATLSGLQTYR
jgi:hypothetical protein